MVAPGYVDTPLLRYMGPGAERGELWLKDETQQITGSFKYRGNVHKAAALAPGSTVVTASTGNHGVGLAAAAKVYGLRGIVVLPTSTPRRKLERLESYEATAVLVSGNYEACDREARRIALRGGFQHVSSFDDEEIIEGHRSLCEEVDRSGMKFSRVYVPVGGGGLIAACLRHWRDRRVVGVESASAPAMARSLAKGERITLLQTDGFGEGLLIPRVGQIAFETCRRERLHVVEVTPDEMRDAMRHLWRAHGIRAEGAGAASLAAALQRGEDHWPKLCLVTGGNIDDAVFGSIVEA